MGSTSPSVRRSIIYIDGFNFYYGAIKGGPHKWLNLERYFSLLRPHDDIQVIRYFTALVDGSHGVSQETYLAALDTLPLLDVVLGQFKRKSLTCKVHKCTYPGVRIFHTQEEKRTDVNIAISMLDDAHQDLCDRFIVVSGDSDLVPAVVKIKEHFPAKQVVVYIPARNKTRGAAVELRGVADKHRHLPLEKLKYAHFPITVISNGRTLSKPASW